MAKESKWDRRIRVLEKQARHGTWTIDSLAKKYRIKPDSIRRALRRKNATLLVKDYYKRLPFRIKSIGERIDKKGDKYHAFSSSVELKEDRRAVRSQVKNFSKEADNIDEFLISKGFPKEDRIGIVRDRFKSRFKKEKKWRDLNPTGFLEELMKIRRRRGLGRFFGKFAMDDLSGFFRIMWVLDVYNVKTGVLYSGDEAWTWSSKTIPIKDRKGNFNLTRKKLEDLKKRVIDEFYAKTKQFPSEEFILIGISIKEIFFYLPKELADVRA